MVATIVCLLLFVFSLFRKPFFLYITVEGTLWWRWPVKKLSDGGVFFDKHFAYFCANAKVRKTMYKIKGLIF